ncbi:MAG: RNA pseudouridine synthase [Alphaproteobacteria bacterium]|nr:RNA pseudouridine synthase [Alphaproteobacteria bacterium]MAS46806.1 RNA pseudouridine synthase [Alphaproteobacteria bacterium]MAX94901.1 RNA pseudouridine synthase [Alphaproteobacteria bacterium]MBN53646.1 RNA pseudouridine synthase [Alphaproteobacteria bacterium]OUT41629.1 MAG: RNA pseudouridine synthase [Micavibrio sp. TMED2]|tara:strand:+ start:52239 stop:53261 length:1023 start_codon:yes stop_codon:yes gene_type:complete
MSEQATGGSGVQQRTVSGDEHDMRLDRWFKQHFPGLSHGQLEKLLRKGQIRVDGGRVKASTRVERGQTVRIPPMPADKLAQADKAKAKSAARPKPEDREAIERMVLFQDAHVLVLNKPHGLAVQGGSGQKRHIDGMLAALEKNGERPKLVHRLDKDTSGVLILGKTAKATRALTAAFRARDSFKLYWAITVGTPSPSEGDIDAALAKAGGPGNEKMSGDDEAGKRAITRYATIDNAAKQAAWVALRPITGRTHQLRAHLQMIGTPILGDGKYGGADAQMNDMSRKLHLHAQRLILPHPAGGMIDVEAPPPPHFIETMKAFGFVLGDGREGYERIVDAESP